MIVAFTGHRLGKIGGYGPSLIQNRVRAVLKDELCQPESKKKKHSTTEQPTTSPTAAERLHAAIDHVAGPDAAERLYLAVEEAQRVATEQRGSGYFMVESGRWKVVEAAWHDLRRERNKR